MNRVHNARAKNLPTTGNILDSFKKLTDLIPNNDGLRKFRQHSSEAYDKPMPINAKSQETTIDITVSDHDISQIDDSFVTVEGTFTVRCPNVTVTASSSADTDPIIFFGHKASNQCFRQIKLLHNGKDTDYLSQECIREGHAFANLKGRAEKSSKKHVYTLYEDVNNFNPGVAGTYVRLSEFKNGNKTATINFKYIVPLSDLILLQTFSMYPSNIIGQLSLKLAFSFDGLVWTQVNPSAVRIANDYLNNTTTASTTYETTPYDHFFHQIGEVGKFVDTNNTPLPYTNTSAFDVVGFSITKISSQMMGYNVRNETIEAIHNHLKQMPLFLPAQSLDYIPYPAPTTGGNYSQSAQVMFENVECISVMFPTTPQQITCFKNPNIQNFQLKIDNALFPPVPIATNTNISPEFLTYQLNASDLDGSIEPTKSWMSSITESRTDMNDTRYANSRFDDTDFMLNISTERSQGGFVFDGMSSTKPINVELRFSPVVSGNNDVYYRPDGDNLANVIQVPPELWLCRDVFFECGVGYLKYHREGSPK